MAGGHAPADIVAAAVHTVASGGPEPAPVACTAAELGWIHERALDPGRRHRDGVHYTPAGVSRRLAALAIGQNPEARICDPSVGGGSFLLAAADHLLELGVAPAEIVGERLFGIDVDPAAVTVTAEALRLWAVEHGASAHPTVGHLVVADTLEVGRAAFAACGVDGFDAVVGNPPFQNQLGSGTARSAGAGAELRARWAVRAGPYADTAAWFLLAGLELTQPGGACVLVQPQSVLAAADVEPIRHAIEREASMEGMWWGGTGVFAAGVAVCAPLLRRTPGGPASADPVRRWTGPDVAAAPAVPAPTAATWAPAIADFLGAPAVSPRVHGRLGDIASATAGFRDEYYGMTAHMRDDAASCVGPRLITVGMIDSCHDRWGSTAFRIAKQRWRSPRVDLASLRAEQPRIAAWVEQRLHPKVLVATQTKVVEAVVDIAGDAAPCTPVVAVTAPSERLWHVAAALVCPVTSALALGRVAGAALSSGTVKLSAAQVLDLPLPFDGDAWDRGAAAARAAQEAGSAADRTAALERLGGAMNAAYGVDDEALLTWWLERQPVRD